jgi:hypothetical protein
METEYKDFAAFGENLYSTYDQKIMFLRKPLYPLGIPQLVVLGEAHTVQTNPFGLFYEIRWIDVRTARPVHRVSM